MRIAVSCKGLDVSQYFDHAECLTCYTVNKGIIAECQTLPFSPVSADANLALFSALEVDALICGQIHIDEANQYCVHGIEVVAGVTGPASVAAQQYLNRTLSGFEDVCGESDEE